MLHKRDGERTTEFCRQKTNDGLTCAVGLCELSEQQKMPPLHSYTILSVKSF